MKNALVGLFLALFVAYNLLCLTFLHQTFPDSSNTNRKEEKEELRQHNPFCTLQNDKLSSPLKRNNPNAEQVRHVHLIAYIGVEGTGHHFVQGIFRSLADVIFSKKNPKTSAFFQMMQSRFSGWSEIPRPERTNGSRHVAPSLVQPIDEAAEAMDKVIEDSSNSSKVFAFADWSNPFSGRLFSGVDPTVLVELAEKSRHNVSLSVLVLHRNWTKIIWSTALRRNFGSSVAHRVIELKNAAMVLHAQLASVPLCSWRNFNMEDYPNHPEEYQQAFADYFHLSVNNVKHSFHSFRAANATVSNRTVSKYDTLWTKEDLAYVQDTFDGPLVASSMRRLTDPRHNLLAGFDKVGCHC